PEHLLMMQIPWPAPPPVEILQRPKSPRRERSGARGIEIGPLRGPGKLGGPERFEIVHGGSSDGGHARRLSLGSVASRMPSPTRLNPRTAPPMARPGTSDTHGAPRSRPRPSDTMAPQLGVGGCAPSPTNDSAASAMIAPAMPSVAATMIWARTF